MSDITTADDFEFELQAPSETLLGKVLEQTRRQTGDPISQAFPRVLKATSNTDFQWGDPGIKDQFVKEIPLEVFGLRGILLNSSFGFMLYDDQENKVVCSTVSAEPMGAKITKSQPMARPIYAPAAYDTTNTPAAELRSWNPMGARGEYCAECVFNQNHTVIGSDGKPRSCGLTSSVLFYVLAVGTRVLNRATKELQTRWVNVVDIEDNGEKLFDAPFILNIQVSRFGVMKAIRPNGLVVKTASNGGMCPEDAGTLKQFLESVEARNKNLVEGKTGLNLVNGIVELFAAQPVEAQAAGLSKMIKNIPVWALNEEPELNKNILGTIKAALREYTTRMSEYDAVEYGKPVPMDSTPNIVRPLPMASEPANNPVNSKEAVVERDLTPLPAAKVSRRGSNTAASSVVDVTAQDATNSGGNQDSELDDIFSDLPM